MLHVWRAFSQTENLSSTKISYRVWTLLPSDKNQRGRRVKDHKNELDGIAYLMLRIFEVVVVRHIGYERPER